MSRFPIKLPTWTFSVGVAGFEPAAPRSQSECATKLRHTPLPTQRVVRARSVPRDAKLCAGPVTWASRV
jgi:hypothetical protein